MDLRNWEKIDEDEASVTMRHPKGHTMQIAVKALPKIQAEQIRRLKMADGGGISEQGKDIRHGRKMKLLGSDDEAEMSKDFAKDEAKGRAEEERMIKPKMKGLAKGGKVQHYDQAGVVEQADDQKDEGSSQPAGGTVININPGGPAQPTAPAAQAAPPPPPPPQTSAVSDYLQSAPNVPQPPTAQPVSDIGPNGSMNPRAILKNTEIAGQGQQDIDSAKAQAEVENTEQLKKALAENAQQKQKVWNDMVEHTKNFAEAVEKGQIKPNAYMENMSSGKRMGTALGLALGGMGASYNGGHNYAMDFLNKQIDRDVDAQKTNLGQKKTVLEAYQHLYGEGAAAEQMTRASLYEAAKLQSNQIAAQLGTQQAAVNNARIQAELTMKQSEALKGAAVDINNLPGTAQIGGQQRPLGQIQPPKKGAGKGAPSQGKNEGGAFHNILNDDANQSFLNRVSYDPRFKELLPQIESQKARATMADDAIKRIDNSFPRLHQLKGADQGGVSGYAQRKAHALSAIPFVGEPLAQAADVLTDNPENREYNSLYSSVTGAVRGALQGNVAEDLLERTVRANSPEMGDTVEDSNRKKQALIDFIKEHTPHDLLDTAGLTRKSRKKK